MPRPQQLLVHKFVRSLYLAILTFCLCVLQPWDNIAIKIGFSSVAVAQEAEINLCANASSEQQMQQGVDYFQSGNYEGAIACWQQILNQDEAALVERTLAAENLARVAQEMGQYEQSFNYWQQALEGYQALGDEVMVSRTLTEQAQTYNNLGQYRQAIALLCGTEEQATAAAPTCEPDSALQLARHAGDPLSTVAVLGSLGETYRLLGVYQTAIQFLESGLNIELSEQSNQDYHFQLHTSLGHAHVGLAKVSYRQSEAIDPGDCEERQDTFGDCAKSDRLRQAGQQHDQQALEEFQASLAIAQQQHPELQLNALINTLRSYRRLGLDTEASLTIQQVLHELANTAQPPIANPQDTVFALLNLVQLLQPLSTGQSESFAQCPAAVDPRAIALVQQAMAIAQAIQNARSESFALGEWGHLLECRGEYASALQWTREAQWKAEPYPDSRYLWEWQAGRILQKMGEMKEAIAAYDETTKTLEAIRNNLSATNRDIQFDFRDTIEPIYRQLVKLRLDQEPVDVFTSVSENVKSALKSLNALKLAELQNFFGNDCVVTLPDEVEVTELVHNRTATVVFNSVIFDEQTAVIATFPNNQQQVKWIPLSRQQLRQEVNDYRREAERFFSAIETQAAQKVYDRIIRPFADRLEQEQIKTLVFIQDGILRSVPMAALYDGESYLVERYAIALSPSLNLSNPTPQPLVEANALLAGASFDPSPSTELADIRRLMRQPLLNVSRELQIVSTLLPKSRQLLDGEFTRDRLIQELSNEAYSVIHIATHGSFGTDSEARFLVTGDGQKFTIDNLEALLRSTNPSDPIALLTLTACQTAVGDNRATLGLAGIAAQAGASSVLASLWFINDAATPELVQAFYKGLIQDNLSKAEALQAAQIALINSSQYKRPAYWAPFILIGNWL